MTVPAGSPLGAGRQRLVVYTALVGPKEALNNPLDILPADASTDLDLDFVCITDDKSLTSPVWRFVYLPTAHLPPEKLSRRPKALPHEYFPDVEHSLYIDNTVSFKRLPQAADLATDRPYLFRAFQHARHTQLDQEAFAIASLGYEDSATICTQLGFYQQRGGLAGITPLTTATLLLRSHHHPTVQQHGRVWWENILAFAKRDQLSFDFALRQAGAQVHYLPGITRDNPFIRWQGSLSPSRLRASFDAKRYAWLHRDQPAALDDPKAHALAHGRGSEPAYQRTLGVLELLCFQQGSSLGGQVSPRRAVVDVLDNLLAPHRHAGSRFVIVRVQGSPAPLAFSANEFEAAGQALALYMGAGTEGTVLDVSPQDLADPSKVYTATGKQTYDLVLVLGLDGGQWLGAVQKLMRLLSPRCATLAAVLTSAVPLASAAEAEQIASRLVGRGVQALLQGARHDGVPGLLANSVAALGWVAAAAAGA